MRNVTKHKKKGRENGRKKRTGRTEITDIINKLPPDGIGHPAAAFRFYSASFNITSLVRAINLLMRSGERLPWLKRARSYSCSQNMEVSSLSSCSSTSVSYTHLDVYKRQDLGSIRPTVSFPHLPENTRSIDEVERCV